MQAEVQHFAYHSVKHFILQGPKSDCVVFHDEEQVGFFENEAFTEIRNVIHCDYPAVLLETPAFDHPDQTLHVKAVDPRAIAESEPPLYVLHKEIYRSTMLIKCITLT